MEQKFCEQVVPLFPFVNCWLCTLMDAETIVGSNGGGKALLSIIVGCSDETIVGCPDETIVRCPDETIVRCPETIVGCP